MNRGQNDNGLTAYFGNTQYAPVHKLVGHTSARTHAICRQAAAVHKTCCEAELRTMLIRRFQRTMESEMSAGSSNSEFNKHIPI